MRLVDRFVKRSRNRSPQSKRRLLAAVIVSSAVLVGSIAAVAVATAEDEPETILANDFEAGSFTPWQPRGSTLGIVLQTMLLSKYS
jgi:endo-1,4-beta-xylanase